MSYATVAVVSVGILEAVLLLWAVSAIRRLGRVESRLGQLTDALTLLTETTESGFRATSLELARVADWQQASASTRPAGRSRRPVTSPRRQPSIDDLVSSAQISRGEARLRLHLAETAESARATSQSGEAHGALHA